MSEKYQVLLVEDDLVITRALKMSLPFKGFEVTPCDTFRKGLEIFRAELFDVILLDVNLPDGNGLELCKEIRKINETIPILLLTAKTDESTAVSGFEWGADDYVRKPYGAQELVARMQRLIERKKGNLSELCFDCLKIDLKKHLAWAKNSQLNLGKREFEILALLIKRSGEAVTRNDILNTLGDDLELYDRTIDSHLSHLRKKLKNAGATQVQIVPIYGVGYRLELK